MVGVEERDMAGGCLLYETQAGIGYTAKFGATWSRSAQRLQIQVTTRVASKLCQFHFITVMDRPSTSKPRGTCLYYNDPRGCFAGRKCKFLHGESEHLTPYDSAKMCKYYNQGACHIRLSAIISW